MFNCLSRHVIILQVRCDKNENSSFIYCNYVFKMLFKSCDKRGHIKNLRFINNTFFVLICRFKSCSLMSNVIK